MDVLGTLKPGQVIAYRVDPTHRDSLATAFVLGGPWTHVNLVVEGGPEPKVLNTYPATDAVIVPAEGLLAGRDFIVLDRDDADESWRDLVVREAWGLVGSEYWFSPCSRLTALAFLRAGVSFLRPDQHRKLDTSGWLLPVAFVNRSSLTPVYRTSC